MKLQTRAIEEFVCECMCMCFELTQIKLNFITVLRATIVFNMLIFVAGQTGEVRGYCKNIKLDIY